MSDPNEDFANTVVATMQQNQEEGAPSASAEGNQEPAAEDPILEYAKAIREAGIPPEKARDLAQRFAYMQTPQGQMEMYSSFIRSDAGAQLRQQYGQETLADMLARNPEGVMQMARDLGHKPAAQADQDDEMTTPELKEIRAMKAQQAALESRIKQLSDGASSEIRDLRSKIQGREEQESRVSVFVDWARSQPPMAQKAVAAVSRRAHELAALYPEKYQGAAGFRRAAQDAHGDYSSNAQFFQPKSRPKNGSGGGGGVVGNSAVDESKMTLAQKIDYWSGEVARATRAEE